MCDQFGQSFAFLPRRSGPGIRISKPVECDVQKFVCGKSFSTAALPVKGPAKNELRRTILLGSHSSEPMVDQRRLSNPGPGNNRHDVDVLVGPGAIQKGDI